MRKHMSKKAKKELRRKFNAHQDQQWKQRRYCDGKMKAAQHGDGHLVLMMDAMDGRKSQIPFYQRGLKDGLDKHVMDLSVMGVLVAGHGTYLYGVDDLVEGGSNVFLTALLLTLTKVRG